jgi:hypothetical protein
MKKKMGPLPVWAWGLIFGVAVYYFYERSKASSTTSAASTTGILDPNAIDPATGLTYGQEESAALNANATTAATGALGSTGTTTGTDFATQLQTTEGLLSFIQGIDPNFGTGLNAANAAAAAAPAPLVSSTPPPTTPTAHAAVPSPNQALADALQARLYTPSGLPNAGGFITALLGKGFKFASGGTSAGTLVKGSQKFFIFQQGGQTHIREALPRTTPAPVAKAKQPASKK